MRHRKKKVTLDRKKAPRKALLGNLICQVVLYEKIKTTEAKAKAVKPMVERLITRGKVNTLANRRVVMSRLPIKSAAKKIFEVLSPRYLERPGGYLRIIKLGARQGDGAKIVLLEFV
ncbi:MAG: 50S ribosomal protein L17 [Candidatus Komeilibacteria bacterium]|nr:50S ribosomal protein L17 [Candidatus Komeilibacteria bacterium]